MLSPCLARDIAPFHLDSRLQLFQEKLLF